MLSVAALLAADHAVMLPVPAASLVTCQQKLWQLPVLLDYLVMWCCRFVWRWGAGLASQAGGLSSFGNLCALQQVSCCSAHSCLIRVACIGLFACKEGFRFRVILFDRVSLHWWQAKAKIMPYSAVTDGTWMSFMPVLHDCTWLYMVVLHDCTTYHDLKSSNSNRPCMTL